MARIKLTVPETKIASVNIPVRITDINYGNHLGNDAMVSIIHEARMKWLQQHGYTELNIEGVGLIMATLAVEFKNEGFYGDSISATLYVGDISSVGFELYYTMATVRDNNTIILAVAKTEMVCYDYVVKKVVGVPEMLKDILV